MWTTLYFEGRLKTNKKKEEEEERKKKWAGDICKGTPDIEFEQDWSVILGATLGDG